jgi:hypothetical protein
VRCALVLSLALLASSWAEEGKRKLMVMTPLTTITAPTADTAADVTAINKAYAKWGIGWSSWEDAAAFRTGPGNAWRLPTGIVICARCLDIEGQGKTAIASSNVVVQTTSNLAEPTKWYVFEFRYDAELEKLGLIPMSAPAAKPK